MAIFIKKLMNFKRVCVCCSIIAEVEHSKCGFICAAAVVNYTRSRNEDVSEYTHYNVVFG